MINRILLIFILIYLVFTSSPVQAAIGSFTQNMTGDSIECDAVYDADSQELQMNCVIDGVEFDF